MARRPSLAASGMYAPSTSRSSAPITGMLTAFVTRPPSSAAATCSAMITPARSCASSVEAARCGVTTTLSSRSEEHTSELQSLAYLVCRLLLEKKKNKKKETLNQVHE